MKEILSHTEFQLKVSELSDRLLKHHPDTSDVVFIGIQQGGVVMADELMDAMKQSSPKARLQYGKLDITFYRDDIRRKILAPDTMHIPFSIENKTVILIDDVLFTGRTIKAALDVLLDYGRPAKVELCVLVDRKEHRQFPIQADYVGLTITTGTQEKIKLVKDADEKKHVILLPA